MGLTHGVLILSCDDSGRAAPRPRTDLRAYTWLYSVPERVVVRHILYPHKFIFLILESCYFHERGVWLSQLYVFQFFILFFMKIAVKKLLSPLEKEFSNWFHAHCLRGLQWRFRVLLFCFVVVIMIKLFFFPTIFSQWLFACERCFTRINIFKIRDYERGWRWGKINGKGLKITA